MHLDANRVVEELAAGGFKDRRLAARLRGLAERFVVKPSASFPKALGGSAELEAAYRFFGNVAVTPDAVLAGHFEGVRRRAEREDTVLALHDTSVFTFRHDGQRRADDGKLLPKQRFFVHLALVVTDDGNRRPLGVCGLETWYRGSSTRGGGWHDEANRWSETALLTSQRLGHKSVVHVMDREADDYWLLHNLTSNGERFVVRARIKGERTRMLDDNDFRQLHEAVASMEAVVERDVKLTKRLKHRSPTQDVIHPPREARGTKLHIAARSLTIKRPKKHPSQTKARRAATLAPTITLNVVRVWEPAPPAGEQPVEWVLLTTGCSPAGGAGSQTRTTFSVIVGASVAARRALVWLGCFFGRLIVNDLAAIWSLVPRASRGGWMTSCVGDLCFRRLVSFTSRSTTASMLATASLSCRKSLSSSIRVRSPLIRARTTKRSPLLVRLWSSQ